MLCSGFALLGSTLLLPLFLQTLMGYTPSSPDGAVARRNSAIMVSCPGRLPALEIRRRYLLVRLVDAIVLPLPMTRFDLGIDFRTAALARVAAGGRVGIPVRPINKPLIPIAGNKNNAASGLMNLARNIGAASAFPLSPPCLTAAPKSISPI